MFWFFGQEACGILVPQPGIEPTPPALEGEVLITDCQKSPSRHFRLLIKDAWFLRTKYAS